MYNFIFNNIIHSEYHFPFVTYVRATAGVMVSSYAMHLSYTPASPTLPRHCSRHCSIIVGEASG